jgi:ABC-type branched-subunit amino acid transport system substrate-binding protein
MRLAKHDDVVYALATDRSDQPLGNAVQAASPDIVFVATYPPDTVGIIRAANEISLVLKMFGGAMIGMLVTPIKVQLGPLERPSHRRRLRSRSAL